MSVTVPLKRSGNVGSPFQCHHAGITFQTIRLHADGKQGHQVPRRSLHLGDMALVGQVLLSSAPILNASCIRHSTTALWRSLDFTMAIDPRFISYFLRCRARSFLTSYSDKCRLVKQTWPITSTGTDLHEEAVRVPHRTVRRATGHRARPRHAGRQNRAQPTDERDAGGDGAERCSSPGSSISTRYGPRWRGRDTGLPKDIADLFPDRLVDSELGEIPLGWPVESLADHFEAVKGVSYKGAGLGGDGVPLHNLNSVHEGGGYKHEGIKFYSGEYAERHRVRPGDVIVANTEQGHERLLIGYAAIVPGLFGTDGIVSHHIYRLRSRSSELALRPDSCSFC